MDTQNAYYQESGNITPGRLALGILIIIAAALVLGYLYGALVYLSPLIYINALICIGFGLGVGYAAIIASRVAHLRSPAWRLGFAVFAGVLAYLFHWCAYLPMVLNEGAGPGTYLNFIGTLASPGEFFSMIRVFNLLGVWEIAGIPNSGTFGWIIWLIEMLIIIGAAIFIAIGAKIHPYSENQGRFYDKYNVPDGYSGSVGSPLAFVQEVQTSGYAPFERLEPPRPNLYYTFTLYYLEGETRHYLDITRTTIAAGSDGKVKKTDTVVVDNLALDTSTAQRIKTELKAKKSSLGLF